MEDLYEMEALEGHEDFIRILDGRRPYYGGDQEWFEDGIYKKVGCAAVAAANITSYLARGGKYKKLNKSPGDLKSDFKKHMSEVIKYVDPDPEIGIISTLYFIDRVVEFAKDRGVQLKAKWTSNLEDFDMICKFIKEALRKNLPIAILMYKNKELKNYDWHWMTITKYFKNQDYTYIKVSTWGECRLIRLEDFYKYSAYGSMVYFT